MPYGAETTTDELLEGRDLSGMRALVTGASAGLGVETTRALAAHGANVVMAVRDLEKGQRAAAMVRESAASGASVEMAEVDLASLASVRACADRLLADGRPLNLLIANAGIMACPQSATADGFETQFGTNHLGHFVFVNKLVPLAVAGAPSRIVVLSSSGHRFSDVDLADPNFETTPYDPWAAYGRSKTANVLFAVGLDRKLRSRGVRACAIHPGGIRTELGRHMTPEIIQQLAARRATTSAPAFKTVPQGAATTIWAGVVAEADEVGGRFCEDCHVGEVLSDPTVMAGVRPYALDPVHADALWAKSEELVGERFSL